jgi:hypothetical protein
VENVPEHTQVSIHNQWSYAKKIKQSFEFKKRNFNEFRIDPAAHFKESEGCDDVGTNNFITNLVFGSYSERTAVG